MEPEVHICEKWLQTVHLCLTATNIRADGNKEIDILGINPRKDARVHLESNCRIGHVLNIEKKFKHKGKTYENELEYFAKEKFNHPKVIKKVNEFFGNKKYDKTLIVWNFDPSIDNYSRRVYGIGLYSLNSLIEDLHESIKDNPRGHRDDILRLIELLVSQDEAWEKQNKVMLKENHILQKTKKATKKKI